MVHHKPNTLTFFKKVENSCFHCVSFVNYTQICNALTDEPISDPHLFLPEFSGKA